MKRISWNVKPRHVNREPAKRTLRSLFFLLAGSLAILLVSSPGFADDVLMANGGRITGAVQTLGDGKLTVKTPYNKALELDWASVKSVIIPTSAEIVLSDGTQLIGTVETADVGIRVVTGSAGTVPIADLSLIQAINPPKKPPVTYTGDIQAAASLTSGNSDTVSGNLSGKFVARSKKQRLTLRAGWNYAEDTGKVSARDANGSVKYDFFPLEKLYTYVNSLLEYNSFQDLNLRATMGGGLGYQFFENDRESLAFELGVSYVNVDYNNAADDAYAAGRWSVNAEYKVIPDRISLFHFHEGYFGFEDIQNLYLRTEQGVRFTIIKDFYSTFQANLTYDNAPAAGTEDTDTTLLFGLGYNFDL